MSNSPSFTVGIEEEYLLVDRQTRDLITEAPKGMLPECERLLRDQVTPEFLQSQIEVGTGVAKNLQEAREDLGHLRRTVSNVAEEHGLAIIAASTHPFADWASQRPTPKQRYSTIARDLQEVVRRLVISGMHVHVGLDDDDLRIDLLGQVAYIVPHLIALSTSSPFWQGNDTGLKSYRIAVWNEMPRTGLPESFDSYGEYQRHVQALVKTGLIEDASKLWWDVRPSARFPTLEFRAADLCTRLEDGICVAAMYSCWLHMLHRLRQRNQRWRQYRTMLIDENRWRAQRYGIDEGLVDFGRLEVVPYAELLEEILLLLKEDAAALGCQSELEHSRTIVRRGTSAHRQVAVFQQSREAGAERHEALRAVVDMLIEDTLEGVP